jgi:protein-S-isoprenylcysteine O-methyltransferase Ste14
MQIIFIPVEERSMSDTFGEKYSDYKKKARMWF